MSDRQAMRRGDGKVIRIAVSDAAGSAIDLSDYPAISFALARRVGGTTLVSKSLSGGGVSVVDLTGGLIDVTLDPADTADLRPGVYYFELQLMDGAGVPTTLEFDVQRLLIEADLIREES